MTVIKDVDLDVATALATRLSMTLDTNVFAGQLPPASAAAPVIPVRAIGVEEISAPPSVRRVVGGAVTGEFHGDTLCRVLVREDARKPGDARALAKDAIEAMHLTALTGYTRIRCAGTPFRIADVEAANDASYYTFELFADYEE